MEPENNKKKSSEPEKASYEPPRIVYREPLEAVATSCTPSPPAKGNLQTCPEGPISS
jgi:hypothetical protein